MCMGVRCLFVTLFVFRLCVCLIVGLFVYVFAVLVWLSVDLSLCWYVCLFVCLCWPFVCMFVPSCVSLFVCVWMCLSVVYPVNHIHIYIVDSQQLEALIIYPLCPHSCEAVLLIRSAVHLPIVESVQEQGQHYPHEVPDNIPGFPRTRS